MSFRSLILNLAPRWLKGRFDGHTLKLGGGAKLLYTFGLAVDLCTEHVYQGFFANKPGKGTLSALPYIGRDRGIFRGIDEEPLAYARRLISWLTNHRTRGNPFALMEQLRGYLNAEVRIRTVDANGNWFTWERDGTTGFALRQANWDWDGIPPTPDWSRFWVIIFPTADGRPWEQTQETIGDAELWGGAIVADGDNAYTIGTTATVGQVRDVRAIVDYWKGVGVCGIPGKCGGIIIAFDDASYDPDPLAEGALPDGTWVDHLQHTGDPRVPSRLSTAEYWRGT